MRYLVNTQHLVSEVVGFDRTIGFTQQILEILAKLNAIMDANQAEVNVKMDTNQVKATKQEEMLAEVSARMAINLKEMGG
jgi:hypothetical protein